MKVRYVLGKGVLGLGLTVGLAAGASASCVQGDATGTWKVYAMNSDGQVQRCKVNIDSAGTMNNASCVYHYGSATATVSLTNGSLKLSSGATCSFTGKFTINGVANSIKEVTLSRDKITGAGVGTYSGGAFMLDFTKL